MKSVSLLHEWKHGQNLNEFSIEDASLCMKKTFTSHLERKGEQQGTTLGFVLVLKVVNAGQVNVKLPGKSGEGSRL